MKRDGSIQKKILLLLAAGAALSFSRSARRQFQVLRQFGKEWRKINATTLRRSINALYASQLIDLQESKDGTVKIKLLKSGKQRTLEYKTGEMSLKKPKLWDGKWRVVTFDIPAGERRARDVVRGNLKRLGFFRYQKSVFIHPYPCADEIDFLVEIYGLRRYVRQLIVEDLDDELRLRKEIFADLLR